MKSHRILLLALGLVVLGISKISAAPVAPPNVDWVLTEMNGKAMAKRATLKLDDAKMSVSGVSFVNRYGGTYELKDSNLKFGKMMATLKGSVNPEDMAAEKDYMSMLEKVNSWRITDGKLELLADDIIVARFTEKAAVKK